MAAPGEDYAEAALVRVVSGLLTGTVCNGTRIQLQSEFEFSSANIICKNDCSSSSPRVGRDLGRPSHPRQTKMPLSDERNAVGSFSACLCELLDVLHEVMLRKCLMK